MNVAGQGLGLRREFAETLCTQPKRDDIDFLEVVPDNWMGIGGQSREMLEELSRKYPFVAHGLSLSIGDALPIDLDYVKQVRQFLDRYGIDIHSDHLSLSRDQQGYLHELIPVPRNRASAAYIADKVKAVQDITSRRLVLENISYYHEHDAQMPEAEFVATVIEAADCGLLLDINNVYVNSKNHHSDPFGFIDAMPANAVTYLHVAGHLDEPGSSQVLDTHGTPVAAAVIELGAYAMGRFGDRPIVLERDNHVPSLAELCEELSQVRSAIAGKRSISP